MGDHLDPKNFDAAKFESALRELLSSRSNEAELNSWARTQVERDFDVRKVAGQIEGVYAHALQS